MPTRSPQKKPLIMGVSGANKAHDRHLPIWLDRQLLRRRLVTGQVSVDVAS